MPLWHAQELGPLLHNAISKRSIDKLLCSYFSCSIFNILNRSEEPFTVAVLLTVHLRIFHVLLTVHLSIFDVWLTVHLSIFISVINQLDVQNFVHLSWLITEINISKSSGCHIT